MKDKYNKTEWINGQTRVTADHMNNIENGISTLFKQAVGTSDLASSVGIKITRDMNGRFILSLNYQILEVDEYRQLETVSPEKIYLLKRDNLLVSVVIGGIELTINNTI